MTGKCNTGTDRVDEAFNILTKKNNNELDNVEYIVNIQGDEPGVNSDHIDLCIEALESDTTAVMSTIVKPLLTESSVSDRNIMKCVMDRDLNALYFSRAAIPFSKSGKYNAAAKYFGHVGLYVFRRDFLLDFPNLPYSLLEEEEDLEQLRILESGISRISY